MLKIKNCYKNNIAMDSVLHNKSLNLYRLYLCVGGMPESINNLLANDKDILNNCLEIKKMLISSINTVKSSI